MSQHPTISREDWLETARNKPERLRELQRWASQLSAHVSAIMWAVCLCCAVQTFSGWPGLYSVLPLIFLHLTINIALKAFITRYYLQSCVEKRKNSDITTPAEAKQTQ